MQICAGKDSIVLWDSFSYTVVYDGMIHLSGWNVGVTDVAYIYASTTVYTTLLTGIHSLQYIIHTYGLYVYMILLMFLLIYDI